MKEEKEENYKVFFVLIALILLTTTVLFWHPWVNEERIKESYIEYANICTLCPIEVDVVLTRWGPLTQDFKVYINGYPEGHGTANIRGRIIEFNYVWQEP